MIKIPGELDVTKAREAFARLRHRAVQPNGPPISTNEILQWKATGRR